MTDLTLPVPTSVRQVELTRAISEKHGRYLGLLYPVDVVIGIPICEVHLGELIPGYTPERFPRVLAYGQPVAVCESVHCWCCGIEGDA